MEGTENKDVSTEGTGATAPFSLDTSHTPLDSPGSNTQALFSPNTRTQSQPRSFKPLKYQFTPEQDALIFQTYREKQFTRKRQWVKELSRRFGLPAWKISRRARLIGAYEPKVKEPAWSERELHVLQLNALYCCEVIQRKLRAQGFKRSIAAIDVKRARMRFREQHDPCSAQAVSKCFGIDVHSVLSWIEKGWLEAHKKGTKRHGQQGGDEWIIKDKDIRDFIINNIGIIDIRKVDKWWFVGILAGNVGLDAQHSAGEGEEYADESKAALRMVK